MNDTITTPEIMASRDFKKYYCKTMKQNIWVLGYFGGGRVNIFNAWNLALEMAATLNVDVCTIHIDEIFQSRRFKGFKYLVSNVQNQQPEPDASIEENVFKWLMD